MKLTNGRESLAIPGPTTVPDEVLGAMHRPAIDIYAGSLLALTESLLADLSRIFRTTGQSYIYVANGHGAWEAALANVLAAGETALVLESGRFASGWGEMAQALGVVVEALPGDWRRAVDPAALQARLAADSEGHIKAVLVAQIDTASGVVNDIPAIRAAIDAAGHDALLMVDAVASLATMPFAMDDWGIDVAVSGSQKGLMMVPGLGFVAANDKAMAAHRKVGMRSRYWDWTARGGEEHYQKYCGTPPEHMLFGLRQSLDMLFAEGLDAAIARHGVLAEAVRRAATVWAQAGAFDFNITNPQHRANSVTTLRMAEGHEPAPLLAFCAERLGVVLGIGIGDLSGRAFRIAHMGHLNAPMLLGTLGAIETALAALDMPHGRGGAQAAIDWLAEAVEA
jgi:alanine-glyoxylate transaminase / serine-glyoxylate transaminase / serine-pyruvate transaminase